METILETKIMKIFQLKSIIWAIMSCFIILSCSSSVEPIDPAALAPGAGTPPITENFFKVDFSDQTFLATAMNAQITAGKIIISGSKGSLGEAFGFILEGTEAKTYNSTEDVMVYNQSAVSEFDYTNLNITDGITTNTGTVVITSINTTTKIITGTFKFVGNWSDFTATNPPPAIDFTNGSFQIPYTTTATSTDTFFTKIEGVEFVDTLIATSTVVINGADWFSIGASNDMQDSVTISLKPDLTAGTYPITGDTAVDLVQSVYKSGTETFKAKNGTVTILTKTASRIKGTFLFVSSNTDNSVNKIFTEGTFDVAL